MIKAPTVNGSAWGLCSDRSFSGVGLLEGVDFQAVGAGALCSDGGVRGIKHQYLGSI